MILLNSVNIFNPGYNSRFIQTGIILFASPLKKKKKIDPVIVQARIDGKKRKFAKLIKIYEELDPIKIDLSEYTLPKNVKKDLNTRKRDNQEILNKLNNEMKVINLIWSQYKSYENMQEAKNLKRVLKCKLDTLEELKSTSLDLYKNSLELDNDLFPFYDNMVIKETYKIEKFIPRDGVYIDITKTWKT